MLCTWMGNQRHHRVLSTSTCDLEECLRPYVMCNIYKKIRLIRSLKKFIFRYQDLVKIYSVSAEKIINDGCIKIRGQQKCQNIFLSMNVWRKSVFYIYFTEFGAAFTAVLPVLFKYCYKYCYSDSRKLWAVMKAEVWRFKIWFNPPFL
jgi:hypothetical protein